MIANVLASCAQIALVVAVCAPLPRLLGLRSPSVQYLFWRVLLATCLLLPVVQPYRAHVMEFVPAPAGAALFLPGTDALPASAAPPAPAAIDWWRMAGLAIAAGAAVRLTWIAAGMLRLRRMRRHAVEEASGFDDLERTIGVSAPMLWSRDVTHPVTFGVIRPVVLLPVALKSVDAAARRAVAAHELHHVKRRDWLWIVAEEVVRSLLWFHPAVWWLISRVQLARETVVDELSILTTNARRTYLDTLLAFADDTGLDMSPAFSARRHLVHRVMLLSREDGMSSRRIGAAACLLAVALCAGAWGAVSAFPLHETRQRALPPPPAPRESQPRDPLPPKAPRIPVTISFDNAELASVVRSFARIAGLDVAPDSDLRGRVTFEATEMAWYEALRQILEPHGLTFRVKDDTLSVVRLASPPPPPRGARVLEGLHPRRIGGDIRAPAKIKDVRPIYTPIAMRAGVQGVVIIETVIDEDGNVAQARVLRSLPLLDQAALDAVKDWKYEPTYVNGVPRAVIMAVTVDFNLR